MTIWKVRYCSQRTKGQRGTKDQFLIVKILFKNCKRRLTMTKKAYVMVPHSCLKKCMMFRIAENVQNVLVNNNIEKWKA